MSSFSFACPTVSNHATYTATYWSMDSLQVPASPKENQLAFPKWPSAASSWSFDWLDLL